MPLKSIPVLPAKDFDETAEFYGRLGFTEHSRYPDYLIVTRSADLEFAMIDLNGNLLKVGGVLPGDPGNA